MTDTSRATPLRSEDREALLQELHIRLPEPVRQAPHINWNGLANRTLIALTHLVDGRDNVGSLALAAGVGLKFADAATLHSYFQSTCQLFERIRDVSGIFVINKLHDVDFWNEFARNTEPKAELYALVSNYARITQVYLPAYLGRLNARQQEMLSPFVLPPPPRDFAKRWYKTFQQQKEASRLQRKAQSDVLSPLCQILVSVIQLRKQVARQLYDEFLKVKQRVEAGEINVPYIFEYDALLPEVNWDVSTVADIRITGRPVRMRFTAWSPSSWVMAHESDYVATTVKKHSNRPPLQPQTNQLFLQFMEPASDLLWFGDLVKHDLLQNLKEHQSTSTYQQRLALAQEWGHKSGVATTASGLLNPGGGFGMWLNRMKHKPDELIFDPEALYWGIVYGAAFSNIVLTNGSRVGELLQISLDRFKEREIPELKKRMIFQVLLVKGAESSDERYLFPISRLSLRLLDEIAERHHTLHGQIPIVAPNPQNPYYELLQPERYLFQWSSSADQRPTVLNANDVPILIRFMLHGIDLYTSDGERIKFTTHLLRHVMATAARHDYKVPLEALALVLHHGMQRTAMLTESVAPVHTMYYGRQTENKSLIQLHQYHQSVEQPMDLELVVPDDVRLARMDMALQEVFEVWHTLNPTLFGFCGCPTLCPRGHNRELCIGCGFLIPNPDNIADALHWQKRYEIYAQELHRVGQRFDARQAQVQANHLGDLVNLMRIQQKAMQEENYIPAFRILSDRVEG
jgi:hypothetical protein